MNKSQNLLLQSLSHAIWDGEYITEEKLNEEVRQEAIQQTVLPLLCSGKSSLQVISSNVQLLHEQSELGELLKGIPYVILKGTAAEIYYPEPLRRPLGDIDIIVRPENFREVYQLLKEAGYTTTDPIDGNQRHVLFNKGRVLIELHRRFATLQTKKLENLLDEWIYEGINTHVIEQIQRYSFPRLDDTLNGLVLLTHINQHLEEGLGLRQILDWIMYCNKNLSDETWPEFKKKTDQLGLTTLAKVTARLGQKYFGLKEDAITWCRSADEKTVDDFLEYVFSCGNFGQKDSINNTVVMVMVHGRGVRGFFRNLQRQGKINWKALEKHKWLTSFAWLYQMCRYVRLGLKINNCKEFLVNYNTSKQRSKLLDKLEVTRTAHKTGN